MSTIPAELQNQKYISLTTFRKTGVPVRTPVWFAEEEGKLYIFTNPKSGKVKRIRNNPHVRIAPSTLRGRVTGPEFPAMARILPREDWPRARTIMERKYWLMRVPFLWSKESIFMALEVG
ncbi:MAG TPA: PPOX class F420-dependent oxidoreductase [Terriglobales bacterium]|nr:PPOX class F420-dependent oxidoreductase [Terriglobales bacterium]